jgi:hypothetical protein
MTKPIVRVLVHRRRRFDAEMFQRTHRSMIIRGKWSYLYRAVDKHGKTVDFLLRPDRGIAAGQAFFRKALSRVYRGGRARSRSMATCRAIWPFGFCGASACAARSVLFLIIDQRGARPGSRAARAAIECQAGPGHAYTHARDLRVPTATIFACRSPICPRA